MVEVVALELVHVQVHLARARETLGWAPTVPLEAGLRLTAAWFEEALAR